MNDSMKPQQTSDATSGDATSIGRGRRGKTRAEERIEALDTSGDAMLEQIAELQARAETAEAEARELRDEVVAESVGQCGSVGWRSRCGGRGRRQSSGIRVQRGRVAYTTAWVRSLTESLRRMELMWFLTVCSLIDSA